MSFFPPFPRKDQPRRTPGQEEPVNPQAYVDNPSTDYDQLIKVVGGIDQPLGTISEPIDIGIVGLGAAGTLGAAQLLAAGAQNVTAYEWSDEPGGRFKSVSVPGSGPESKDVYELGAMRFPPSETLLYRLAAARGFGFISEFPNPGIVPTLICDPPPPVLWSIKNIGKGIPFQKTYDSFLALRVDGIKHQDSVVCGSLDEMCNTLRSSDRAERETVVPIWQKWLTEFKRDTFEQGLKRIFGEEREWDFPGHDSDSKEFWNAEDFQTFGDVGIGSGGFKDMYPQDFTWVMGLIPNGLENMQSTFASKDKDSLSPAPIQDLLRAEWELARKAGLKTHFEAKVTDVTLIEEGGQRKFRIDWQQGDVLRYAFHDVVILTAQLKVELMQKLAKRDGNDRLFTDEIRKAMLKVKFISSTKLINQIHDYTSDHPELPRVVLTNQIPGQIYTLRYDTKLKAKTLVAIEHYGWGDGSTSIEHLTAEQLHDQVIKTLIEKTKDHAQWADIPELFNSSPKEVLVKIDWQTHHAFCGAFVVPFPGHMKHLNNLKHDFQKLKNDPKAPPIFLSSDSTTQESGWADGAFRAATNVSTAIIAAYGQLSKDVVDLAPVNVMNKNQYTYD